MPPARDASPDRPFLSIVIPALDEAAALPGLLASLAALRGAASFETLLVDGGSRDGTVERFRDLTRDWPARGRPVRALASGRPGRAAQLNEGARACRGEAILFLHADTHLRPGALAVLERALADPRVVGGGFRHRFRDRGALLRIISLYATARSMLTGIYYGDQGLFVKRSAYEAAGGFPDIPLFEDLRFSRTLRRHGRVVTLPIAVETSSRRLRSGGIVRTAARFGWLKIRHALGADPERLRAEYPDIR